MESGKFADYRPISMTSMGRWIDDTPPDMMLPPIFFETKIEPEADLTLEILQASYNICLKAYGNPTDPRMDGPRERLESYKNKR